MFFPFQEKKLKINQRNSNIYEISLKNTKINILFINLILSQLIININSTEKFVKIKSNLIKFNL